MENFGVTSPFQTSKNSWADIVKLRQACQDDEGVAMGMLTDPSATLERLGLDIAFEADGERPRFLSQILENLSISTRSDVLQPLLQSTHLATDDPYTEIDEGIGGGTVKDPGIILGVNAVVVVNVGGFVNAALVVNVGVFANVATGTNVSTSVGGTGASASLDASASSTIRLSEEFVKGELARHFHDSNLSSNRQRSLMHFVVEKYRNEIEAMGGEAQSFDFSYRGKPFSVSVSKDVNGDLVVQGGQLLH